jgi:hypothetical protein
MELGVVDAEDDDGNTWEVASPTLSSEALSDGDDAPIGPVPEHEDPLTETSDELAAELEQQVNFITREHRSSDRTWRPKRFGDGRGRASTGETVKQRLARKNTCWNCGKVGHFLVDCPFQRSASTSATVNGGMVSAASKPNSKKF